MNKYIPAWTNKTTQSRTQAIISWLESTVGSQSVELHSQTIRRIFGNSDLGRYLKNLLLVCVNPSYQPMARNKCYRINEQHLNRVRAHMGLEPISLSVPKQIRDRFDQHSEIIESGRFDYRAGEDTRSYNGLQYVPRQYKNQLWSERGYCYDYDIRACAPTLLIQRYHQLNPKAKPLHYLQMIIDHKDLVRSELAINLKLNHSQIKTILNALLLGACLSHRLDNKIMILIKHNHWLMRELRLNEFLDYLIEDIRQLWRVLGSDISRGVFYDCQGHRRRYRLSGRDKTNYYKKLETEVMSSLKQFIYKQTQRVFWEHDGFRSAVFFVPEELSEIIRSRTGYVVRFDWGKMELDDSI